MPKDKDTKRWSKAMKESSIEKNSAEFRNLFSPKYVKWIEIEAELMAQNNYGAWGSVEEANALVDRAIKDLSETIKAGEENEVNRLVDDKREDIVVDMTENVVEGPNLPKMGPDQMLPQQPMQAPAPESLSPQTLSPTPASKSLSNVTRILAKSVITAPMSIELKAAFDNDAMLELRPLGGNVNEVETDDAIILFSYSTPVAYQDKATGVFYRTNERFSVTTSRHINKWLDGVEATEVAQTDIENLTKSAGIEDMLKKNKEKDKDKDDDKKDDAKDKKRVTPDVDKKKKVFPFKDKDKEDKQED